MEIKESYVNMQVENVNECYLKSLEILAITTKDLRSPNREFWVFQRIEKAINYYEKKVMDNN